jgi:hypothetical protein
MKVRVTKIKDDAFNGNHTNGINEGYTIIGTFDKEPTVGERFLIKGKKMWDYLHTSIVTEPLNEEGIFKTTYSTYKLENIDEDFS